MTHGTPVCIECGGFANSLNEDEHGDPCSACAERLLETLPGVFHSPWGTKESAAASVEEEEEASAAGRDDPDQGPGGGSYRDPRGSA